VVLLLQAAANKVCNVGKQLQWHPLRSFLQVVAGLL
jgi:hypothetical protein